MRGDAVNGPPDMTQESAMNFERIGVAVTLLNLVLLAHLLAAPRSTLADGAPPVLRGRALEIVDGEGRVRASIKIEPPTGNSPTDTVVLRLIDGNGRPEVKIAASERASGLSVVGATDRTHVLPNAEGEHTTLKLSDGSGGERVLQP